MTFAYFRKKMKKTAKDLFLASMVTILFPFIITKTCTTCLPSVLCFMHIVSF